MYEFTRLHPLSKDYNEIPQANPTNHSTPLKIINLSLPVDTVQKKPY